MRIVSHRTFAAVLATTLALLQPACSSSQQQTGDDMTDEMGQQGDDGDKVAQDNGVNDQGQAHNGSDEGDAAANNNAASQGNGNSVDDANGATNDFASNDGEDAGDFGANGNAANGFGKLTQNASPNTANATAANAVPAAANSTDAESMNAAPLDAEIANAVDDKSVQEDITAPDAPTKTAMDNGANLAGPANAANAATTPPPAAAAASPETTAMTMSHDLMPINYGVLHWVGYKFDLKARELHVDIVTRGSPQYEIFQEQNHAQQPELIIRFLETSLRRKIRRDMDASEFRSPVAFIRMREDPANRHVDVVLTLRDPVQPKLYAKNGNLRLTYKVPTKYLGNLDGAEGEVLGEAQVIKPGPILPTLVAGSDNPRRMAVAHIFVPNPAGNAFQEAPPEGGAPLSESITPPAQVDEKGLPASFGKEEDLVPMDEEEPSIDSDGGEFEFDPGAALSPAEMRRFGMTKLVAFSIAAVAHASPLVAAATPTAAPRLLAQVDAMPPTNDLSVDGGVNGLGAAAPGEMPAVNAASMPANTVHPAANGSGAATATAAAGGGDLEGQENEGDAPARQYSGRPMSIEFNKAPLSLVLQTFGEESGNNFIMKDELGTRLVTLKFKNVPWDEALVGVLETLGLGMVKVGANVIRIDTVQELAKSLTEIKLTKQAEEESKPTKVLVMRLNHAEADVLVAPIQTMLSSQGGSTPQGKPGVAIKIMADKRTNSIIAEAPPEYLARIKAIVERLDLETPQVEIASRIVEVTRNSNNIFGIIWDTAFNYDPGRALGFGSLPFPNSIRSKYSVDAGVSKAAFNSGFRFGSINNMLNLDAFLSAEETKGTTNILQSNKVIVVDRQDAMVKATKTFFVATTTYQNGVPVTADIARNFDLSLQVNPKISNDGYVAMNLHIYSSTPGAGGQSSQSRAVDTVMSRRSGETGVIGGIYDTTKSHNTVGIPWLSSLPIIGALFRREETNEAQTELLVMITPTILERSSTQKPTSEFKNFSAGDNANVAVVKNGASHGNEGGNVDEGGANNASNAGNNGGNDGAGNANANSAGDNGNAVSNFQGNDGGDKGANGQNANMMPQSEGNGGDSAGFDNTSNTQDAGGEAM